MNWTSSIDWIRFFATLAPGIGNLPRTPGCERLGGECRTVLLVLRSEWRQPLCQDGSQWHRARYDGAYADGLGVLKAANIGKKHGKAETTPLRDPGRCQYDLNLADVSEVWRGGSVIASLILALTADPKLSKFADNVTDSGEGRWTIKAQLMKACQCRC